MFLNMVINPLVYVFQLYLNSFLIYRLFYNYVIILYFNGGD